MIRVVVTAAWWTLQCVVAGVTIAVVVGWLAREARAQSGHHGHGHAQHHDWYKDLRQPDGASCCDNRDCRPTRARMTDRETWQAWDGAKWLDIPPDRVLAIRSPDNRSHLCEMNGVVLCFVPGGTMH